MGMPKQANLTDVAREVEEHLSALRRILRQPVETQFARGNLTAPQRGVMEALYRSGGLSLKDLSRQIGLAHSTVSGIVDRLEQRGLAARKRDPEDGRATIIVVSKTVSDYMRREYRALVLHPVAEALRHAGPGARATILEGLRLLRRAAEARFAPG